EGGEVYLQAAAGQLQPGGGPPRRFRLEAATRDKPLADRLAEKVQDVARAANLLALAGCFGREADRGAALGGEVAVEHRAKGDEEFRPLAWRSGGRLVQPGDRIRLRLRNPNKVAVDVSVLVIDEDHRIHAYWPLPDRDEETRLQPGQERRPPAGT